MDIENYVQTKNGNIAGINAPMLELYPVGYVDTMKLPMALAWVQTTTIDPTGTRTTNMVQVDVLVSPIGQSVITTVKEKCKDLRDLFLLEYAISNANAWISNDPPIRISPGTIEFGGYRDVIQAPDETPFHGFNFTMQVEVDINVTCS